MSHLRKRAGKRLREPFGKAGLTVAIVAIVMALVGGAYAAGGLTKAQEKQVTKIAKKYAGKPGAAGAAGTNGTNGKDGAPGAAGKDGANGANGAAGNSVANTSEPPGANCESGGSKFTVGAGSPTYACNGKEGDEGEPGETGEDGDPWTVGGTLPPGATLTGSWAFTAGDDETEIWTPISFSIPLPTEGLPGYAVHYQTEESFPTHCTGAYFNPKAPPGRLCVYTNTAGGGKPVNATFSRITRSGTTGGAFKGAQNAGAYLLFTHSAPGLLAKGSGTFAVTACDPELPEGETNACPPEE